MDRSSTVTILTLKTDKPEAELGLFANSQQLTAVKWQAHRQLASTIHKQLKEVLQGRYLKDIDGIACFKGPGSFTGLRIGLSVANGLAYTQNIPIVARQGKNWREQGIKDLLAGKNDRIATPFYGRSAKTTSPKK